MPDDSDKNQWVKRVLGVALRGDAPAPPPEKLLPLWIEAKEKIDDCIGKLQQEFLATEDEDLKAIVDMGLYGVTEGENVHLMAALREADANPTPDTMSDLLDAVEDYESFLDGARIVTLLEDENAFTPVPFKKVLKPALARIGHIAEAFARA
jgi:hypothetical protein